MDTHFQDGTGSMSNVFVPQKVANTLSMNGLTNCHYDYRRFKVKNRCVSLDAHFQTTGIDRVIYCCGKDGCQYIGYG